MAVVNATEEFERWIEGLNPRDQKTVLQVVKILEQVGIALGEPYSSALKGDDKRFYERAIPRAEQLWEAHLVDLEKEGAR